MNRLTLFVFSLVALLSSVLLQPVLAQEGGNNPVCQTMADGQEYRLARTIQLAEAMPETASKLTAENAGGPRVFHQASGKLMVEEGAVVLLSGSDVPSGFRSDDKITLDAQPAGKRWEWDFRSHDFLRIDSVGTAQDVTELFQSGANEVTLTLSDILSPVYSTTDYWLLVFAPCTPPATPTATPSATPVLTATPLAVATSTPRTPVATALAPAEDVDDGPTMNAGPRMVEGTETVAPNAESSTSTLAWIVGITLTLALAVLGLGLWQGRSLAPELWAELEEQAGALKERLQSLWDEVRGWLETLQR